MSGVSPSNPPNTQYTPNNALLSIVIAMHLQRVEDGEQPGKEERVPVHSKEAQHPGQPQQGEENEGSLDDGAGVGGGGDKMT